MALGSRLDRTLVEPPHMCSIGIITLLSTISDCMTNREHDKHCMQPGSSRRTGIPQGPQESARVGTLLVSVKPVRWHEHCSLGSGVPLWESRDPGPEPSPSLATRSCWTTSLTV